LGNQIDRGTAIDFHVSHMASPVATGGFGGLRPLQTLHQSFSKLKYENYNLEEFQQFLQCQRINRKTKNSQLTLTITSGNFHPNLTLTVTPDDFHPKLIPTNMSGDFHLNSH